MLGLGQGKGEMSSVPRDAATVILLRDTPLGPEVFLVKRTGRAGFLANAMVFPGGCLDETDLHPEWPDRCADSLEDAARRLGLPSTQGTAALALLVAGLRETFEEAGLLIARRGEALFSLEGSAEASHVFELRAELNAGRLSFKDIVQRLELHLATDALLYVARWITPEIEPKRFDTRFFMARAFEGQEGRHDEQETTASAWMRPADVVSACESGTLQLAPPTYRILLELAPLTDVEAALASRAAQTPPTIAPRFIDDDGRLSLLPPGDFQYDGGQRDGGQLDGGHSPVRNRISLQDGRWVSEGRGY